MRQYRNFLESRYFDSEEMTDQAVFGKTSEEKIRMALIQDGVAGLNLQNLAGDKFEILNHAYFDSQSSIKQKINFFRKKDYDQLMLSSIEGPRKTNWQRLTAFIKGGEANNKN